MMPSTHRFSYPCCFCLLVSLLAALRPGTVLAADETDSTGPAAATQPKASQSADAAGDLAGQQLQLAEKYKRFEEVMLRMAELTAPTDPKRAALLRKAVAQSKQQLVGMQLDKVAELLRQDRLSVAISNQTEVNKDLAELLELLLTEEREKGVKDERARLKEQIRRVNELINKERQLQGQTSGGGDMRELAQGQKRVADEAGKLAKDMQRDADKDAKPAAGSDEEKDHDESAKDADGKDADGRPAEKGTPDEKQGESPRGKNADGKPQDAANGKGQPGDKSGEEKESGKPPGEQEDGKNADKKESAEKPADEADKKPADEDAKSSPDGSPSSDQDGQAKDGQSKDSGKPQKGKPSDSPPQPGQSGDSESEDDNAPQQQEPQNSSESARKRVAAAQEKMEQARQKLEKAQRKGAVEEQEAAIRELEQAKAELEEILRQLREEELERMLAMLEARFRKMLQAQIEVYEGTKRVDSVPAPERDRDDEIEAGRLSRRESQIVLEAESALSVLREDGSAAAFPEAVEQMREDMDQIVARLAKSDVGDITQSIEEDVIAALEEMIEALQKAQQDLEKQKQQSPPPQEGEQGDPALIDTLAELKMIRSLQMRVNMRTKRLARLVEGDVGQADKPELLEQLQRLAEREESVFRVTRDIVTGKNK